MLKNKNLYWCQRLKSKWIKNGDENTKYFHNMATIMKNNYIEQSKIGEQINKNNFVTSEALVAIEENYWL